MRKKYNYILCMKWKITSILANRIKCNLIRFRSGPWSTMMKCGAICGVSQRWGRKPAGFLFSFFSCFWIWAAEGWAPSTQQELALGFFIGWGPSVQIRTTCGKSTSQHQSLQEWFVWERQGWRLTLNSLKGFDSRNIRRYLFLSVFYFLCLEYLKNDVAPLEGHGDSSS